MISPPEQLHRPFLFERDTFAFANELVWQYCFDPATGAMTTLYNHPHPTYHHRCFPLVRSARQFFYHARFEEDLPALDTDAYRKLVREVLSRSPRRSSKEEDKVVFPGFDGLRSFSQPQEQLLKAECGGAWQSYFLRSHWRMILPISRAHQERTFEQLVASLQRNVASIVHLVKFPAVTINHGMIVFGKADALSGLGLSAYDPNHPAQPTRLTFDPATKTFSLPTNGYWAGGEVNVIEIYRNWLM